MLTFNLKKQWFDKIKSGEKTHEYREVKPYWNTRLAKYIECISFDMTDIVIKKNNSIFLVCGYASKDDKNKRLQAKIKSISIINGKNTDLAIDKDVYDIEFELI